MYLLPSGKDVMVETRDGLSQRININKIYEPKTIKSKWMKRTDFGHGANNYLFFMGKPIIQDKDVMDAILHNKFIDCKNTAFDFDVSSEFTWDYKELVKIKKLRRRVNRFYTPTAKNLTSQINARKWDKTKEQGSTLYNKEPIQNYKVYQYYKDVYFNNDENSLPGERGTLMPSDPLWKTQTTEADIKWQMAKDEANQNNGGIIPKESSTKKSSTQGRKVKK